MQSAESEIYALIGSVSQIVQFLIAIAVMVLGLAIVRPLNKVAGLAFAGAGGARVVGVALSALIHTLRPKGADMGTVVIFSSISTVIWLVTALVYFGGVIFGAIKLADTKSERGAS